MFYVTINPITGKIIEARQGQVYINVYCPHLGDYLAIGSTCKTLSW